MSRKRYVIECVWTGYRGGKTLCHRTVTTSPERWKGLHTIGFTDNTTMSVAIRPCTPREQVKENHGYDQLLNDIERKGLSEKGYVHVNDLHEEQTEPASAS